MDVSVIIVNYKTCNLAQDCINSIFENTKNVSYEVIVVDNNSNDGSVETFSLLYPQIKIIPLNENIGFGSANNVGVKYAKGEYLFFLNPDTVLKNNALFILSSFLENHIDVALCGGTLFDQNGVILNSYSNEVFPFWRELKSVINILPVSSENHFSPVEYQQCKIICGADMMIRKSDFNLIGGFDTRFFMYYEEPDISIRLQKVGKKIYYIKESEIIHLEGQSECESDFYNQTTRFYYVVSQLRFLKKYFKFYFCVFYVLHFVKALLANIKYNKLMDDRQRYWKSYLRCLYYIKL